MKLLLKYIKTRLKYVIIAAVFFAVFAASFALYRLPILAVIYPFLLCSIGGIIAVALGYSATKKRHRLIEDLKKQSADLIVSFPESRSVEESDYVELIKLLCEEQKQLRSDMDVKYCDMVDYYTVWVHQIKTPIASMRLSLQSEDSALSRKLLSELGRVERYVQMVLVFLRLDSEYTDYVIREYDLNTIVKQSIKKFTGDFVTKKICLSYEPIDLRVVTDEKWLSFILEQILSNALKYTPCGSIRIWLKEPSILCISDTGIGIAPEDLPRIFDRGYTGYNGRLDKKASGIGLYLCKRICSALGHDIQAQSAINNGTTISIDFSQKRCNAE